MWRDRSGAAGGADTEARAWVASPPGPERRAACTMEAWERQPDEPAMWFHRFDLYYRVLGPERTLYGANQLWRLAKGTKGAFQGAANSWKRKAALWRWKERAEAWDAHQRRKRLDEQQSLRDARRERAESLLDTLCERLEQAVRASEVDGATLPQLTQCVEKFVALIEAEPGGRRHPSPVEPGLEGGAKPIRLVEVVKDYGDPQDTDAN